MRLKLKKILYKTHNWFMILLFLLGISQIIIAETTRPGPAMRDPLRDIENTQRLLEMRRQQEYINQQLMYPNKNETEKEESKLGFEEGKKYLFTDITVIGSKLFKNEMDKIIAEYINTEMNEQDIYELLVKLSNVFLTKGYVTTLVTLKYGNINEGQLIYEVKEGKVRNIKMTGKEETTLDKIKLKLAFPMKKGDLLTTQDMDQGLENINVGGYNNMTEIAPTEEYGYSDILIEENYTSTGFSVGMDDSGYKDKGRNKININFSQDNLFGINDRLTLNYIERLTDDRKLDKEANYDIGYSVPIGYWRISYNYNMGDNYNTTISDLGSYKNKSRSKKHKLKVSKIISRGQYHKTTVHGGITYRDNYNTMNGIVIDVSTKKYANTVIGIDHSNRLFGGTVFGIIEYERGVPWFGAEGDPKVLKEGDYKVEYDKLNFNLDWQRMFSIKDHLFQYRMGIGGSYSDDRLLSANQFTMGDEYTVRGFKESSVVGNKGVYINNTITYLGTQNANSFLSAIKPFIGLDGGISRDKDLPNSDKIAGFAIGFRIARGAFNLGFTYGIPLVWAKDMPREQNPIYFNISYNF